MGQALCTFILMKRLMKLTCLPQYLFHGFYKAKHRQPPKKPCDVLILFNTNTETALKPFDSDQEGCQFANIEPLLSSDSDMARLAHPLHDLESQIPLLLARQAKPKAGPVCTISVQEEIAASTPEA